MRVSRRAREGNTHGLEVCEPHQEEALGFATDNPFHSLSPREQEIVRLVAIGYPNKTIAAILDISPWTVATHIRRIFGKLAVHGRAAMIATLAQGGFAFQSRGARALPRSSRPR